MDEEDREFIGFFMGEGCLTIREEKRIDKKTFKEKNQYEPLIKIGLRADNKEIMEWIQKRFGGTLRWRKEKMVIGYKHQPYRIRPVLEYEVANRKACLEIIGLLLKAKLPSRKMPEIILFKRFLDLKKRGKRNGFCGDWYSDAEREEFKKIKLQLSSLKKYLITEK